MHIVASTEFLTKVAMFYLRLLGLAWRVSNFVFQKYFLSWKSILQSSWSFTGSFRHAHTQGWPYWWAVAVQAYISVPQVYCTSIFQIIDGFDKSTWLSTIWMLRETHAGPTFGGQNRPKRLDVWIGPKTAGNNRNPPPPSKRKIHQTPWFPLQKRSKTLKPPKVHNYETLVHIIMKSYHTTCRC